MGANDSKRRINMSSQDRALSMDPEDAQDTITPEQFWIPVVPARDGGSQIGVRGVDGIVRSRIEELTKDKRFGWKRESDYARWAIVHGLDYCAKLKGDEYFSNELTVYKGMVARARALERERAFLEATDSVVSVLSHLIDDGLWDEAERRMIEELRAAEGITVAAYRMAFERKMHDCLYNLYMVAKATMAEQDADGEHETEQEGEGDDDE